MNVGFRSVAFLAYYMLLIAYAPKVFVRAFGVLSPSALRYSSSTTKSTAMSASKISFDRSAPLASNILLIGKKKSLQALDIPSLLSQSKKRKLEEDEPASVDAATVKAMLDSMKNEKGGTATTFAPAGRITLGLLPESVTRNNHPLSVHILRDIVAKNSPSNKDVSILVCDESIEDFQGSVAGAIAKAFPLYSRKTSSTPKSDSTDESIISVHMVQPNGNILTPKASACAALADGVQLACRLVDMPPAELTTTAYSAECQNLANSLPNVSFREIVGQELDKQGYGGLFGVGKAAECPPRLIIMEYNPPNPANEDTVALVGKGIVYDTGGLSLKPKTGMPGMKHDMGGSAGMLGAFTAAVKMEPKQKLVLLLCIAENAIGPAAVRNDDILKMYSGRTVEINNSDAEGRLVLGDGVAHATKHYSNLKLVVDMATLTGAQLIATGKTHSGVLANSLSIEQRAVAAGLKSGDLAFPLVYAPEILMAEFDSKVADMKNSVKDRGNAQSSCAGHFIEAHLHPDYEGEWLHVDMAGPGTKEERGTGYGVGLVLGLLDLLP